MNLFEGLNSLVCFLCIVLKCLAATYILIWGILMTRQVLHFQNRQENWIEVASRFYHVLLLAFWYVFLPALFFGVRVTFLSGERVDAWTFSIDVSNQFVLLFSLLACLPSHSVTSYNIYHSLRFEFGEHCIFSRIPIY